MGGRGGGRAGFAGQNLPAITAEPAGVRMAVGHSKLPWIVFAFRVEPLVSRP